MIERLELRVSEKHAHLVFPQTRARRLGRGSREESSSRRATRECSGLPR